MRRYRSLLLVVAGSLVCAALGYAAALSMAPASGPGAPPTGPVTAEVERRELTSAVVVRGDAAFADAVALDIHTSVGTPIVTDAPMRRGDRVGPGDVVLEVAGRPVVALPGSLPAYRDLRPGDVGPDVQQLESALSSIGLDPGVVDREFTPATSTALRGLYARLGHEPPTSESLVDAGADASEPDGEPRSSGGGVVLPMSEVVFVPGLPRRVDRVAVRRGDRMAERPVTLSGSTLAVSMELTTGDAETLRRGMSTSVEVPGMAPVRARLGAITRTATGARTAVSLPDLSRRQVRALEGANVKVTVPLQQTQGPVLVVPVAALSTDSAGTVRVSAVTGHDTRAVEVEVGLSAQGYAEVRPLTGSLRAGDHVVVGR